MFSKTRKGIKREEDIVLFVSKYLSCLANNMK